MKIKNIFTLLCTWLFITNLSINTENLSAQTINDTVESNQPIVANANACLIGKNINNFVSDIKISHTKYGASDNNYDLSSVVLMEYSAHIDNTEGIIKTGDYITLQIDEKTRLNGNVPRNYRAFPDLNDDQGDLIAVADFNPETKLLKYIFTEHAEKSKHISLNFSNGDALDYLTTPADGTYTFTNIFAGTPYSYTYDVTMGGKNYIHNAASHVQFTGYMPTSSYVTGKFEQIIYIKKAESLGNHLEIAYFSNNNAAPFTENTIFKIYEVPENYTLPDSFNVNFDDLTDVTSSFTRTTDENNFPIFTTETAKTNYVVHIFNTYDVSANDPSSGIKATVTPNKASSDFYTTLFRNTAWGGAEIDFIVTPCVPKKQVIIKKIDSLTNDVLEGVTFDIIGKNGVIETLITNNEGIAFSKPLDIEEYTMVETKSPKGYIINQKSSTVNLNTIETTTTTIEIQNTPRIAKIKKIDATDSNKVLSGVVFTLNKEDKEIYSATTNAEWIATFTKLETGEYILKEKSTLPEYVLSHETRVVTIEEDSKDVNIGTFINQKIPTNNSGNGGWNPPPPTPTNPPIIPPTIPNTETTPPNPPISPIPPIIPQPTPPIPEIPNTPDLPANPTPPPTIPREPILELEIENEEPQTQSHIKKYPKKLPKTGVYSTDQLHKKAGIASKKTQQLVETHLPNKNTFRLAGTYNTNIYNWLEMLPKQDRNSNKYIILPAQGLIMPVNTVSNNSSEYHNFINGKEENFLNYLKWGAVEIPGTSTKWYGQTWNKVIAGHSSYWKNSNTRYKTHFQKIIELDKNEEIWIYEKNVTTGEFTRYVYKVDSSYNGKDTDTHILHPTKHSQLTLFTCTPIGGVTWRWIVTAHFVGN